MAQRIIQIIPVDPQSKAVYYNGVGGVEVSPLTCLALVEKGATQSVIYMETVDNKVEEVDTEDSAFMGFVHDPGLCELATLKAQAETRYEKEQNVESKQ